MSRRPALAIGTEPALAPVGALDIHDPAVRRRYQAECAGKERHVSQSGPGRVRCLPLRPKRSPPCSFCREWHLAGIPGHRGRTPDNGRGPGPFEKLRHRRRPKAKVRASARDR